MVRKKLLRGKALQDRAEELGVSDHRAWSESGINEPEMQRRVLDAERSNRESRLWIVALASAVASAASAFAAWYAVAQM